MLQAYNTVQRKSLGAISVATVGFPIGMMLLAGHLQIAFYGLLTCTLWTLALLCECWRTRGRVPALHRLGACVAAITVGFALTAPQLLHSVELSRISHRVGSPTKEGYAAYVDYALPTAGLVQMVLPGFFGGDSDPANPYWGFYLHNLSGSVQAVRHNTAETAIYVGILPIVLAIVAVVVGLQRRKLHRLTLFFALLAILALMMALGTPVDAVFYFKVPGFSQSGSPARSLVIWSFALSVLAAFGLDYVLQSLSRRQITRVVLAYVTFGIIGFSAAAKAISLTIPGFIGIGVPLLGVALARITEDWLRLGIFSTCGILLLLPAIQTRLNDMFRRNWTKGTRAEVVGIVAVLLAAADLFIAGIRVNPVATAESIYPETAGTKYLKSHVGHERIYPVNMFWSLYKAPHAVLPPNGATVYGLRDLQGYDSLLTGAYKKWADRFALPDPRDGFMHRQRLSAD